MLQIYVSGRLTLFACPSKQAGEWICPAYLSSHSSWHRALDANTFLWLREAIRRTIESGRLADEFQDALERLEWIRAVGLEHWCFSADEIADNLRAPGWFSFNMGLPSWAEDYDQMFLPVVPEVVKRN